MACQLDALPPELHNEFVHQLATDQQKVLPLSQCNRYWRNLCLPFIFSRMAIGNESNTVLERFIADIASPHGHLIKDLDLYFPHPMEYVEQDILGAQPDCCMNCEASAYQKWRVQRDEVIRELFSNLTELSLIHINFEDGSIIAYNQRTFNQSFPALTRTSSRIQAITLDGFEAASLLEFISYPETITSFVIRCTDEIVHQLPENIWPKTLSTNITNLEVSGYCWSIPDVVHIIRSSGGLRSIRKIKLGWRANVDVDLPALVALLSALTPTLHMISLAFETNASLVQTGGFLDTIQFPKTFEHLILSTNSLLHTEFDALFNVFRGCDIIRFRFGGDILSRALFEKIVT